MVFYYYSLPWGFAIADALIFNFLSAFFGFSCWWAVQFISNGQKSTFSMLLSMAAVVLFGSLFIYGGSSIIYHNLFQGDLIFQAYFSEVIAGKLIISSLYICLVILTYYLIMYTYNLRQQENKEEALQNQLRQAELETLKFQINPHFIFNSLNSISGLTITEPDKAREMVIKLSGFLRGSLGKEKEELQTVKEELEQMKLYLDIEKTRFEDRLCVDIKMDPRCEQMKVPNMILQPLYENAIKHGIYEQLEKVSITSRFNCESGNLKIEISNNYDSHSKPQKGKGIGLKNIRSRLELIYGLSDLVTIEKERDKFTVHLLIPQLND